jgi:3-dehydroquinate dehydratase-1
MQSRTDAPLVVGTVRPDGLARLVSLPLAERGADIIEARFDLAMPPPQPGDRDPERSPGVPPDLALHFPACRQLEQSGSPVLGTIRLVADGGHWPVDAARLSWFERALDVVSWVDIEVESLIAAQVVAAARARRRRVIVSHHDFARTPDAADLDAVVARARGLGADVVKVATMVRGPSDHDLLIDLLRRHRDATASSPAQVSLALVGMGPFGTSLRSYLPCVGSRLTYGFLDQTAAPGQLPAPELMRRLRADCPAYSDVHPVPGEA